jgi:hypothetical protein
MTRLLHALGAAAASVWRAISVVLVGASGRNFPPPTPTDPPKEYRP